MATLITGTFNHTFIWIVVDAYMSCAHAKQLDSGNMEGVYLKVLNVAQATGKPGARRLPVTFAQVEWHDKEEPSWISRSALRKLLGRKPADDEIAAVMGIQEVAELPGYPQMSLKPPLERPDEPLEPLSPQNVTPPALKSEELDFATFFAAWQQLSQKKATPAEMLAYLAKNATAN
ncbi:hypothetical protein C7212DRAFT_348172 [Tuber magnatum]|uniref:Uncharacterized protein n=1 Tax=Tuber magnatum TaxID=42249 RepID=A0A317SE51_9PEZI|nr:hypothetical protein C7212DRAFT_348172 [Tuber magnatum]